ncbi:MAG: ShlB/FhaC/HecB family hemolysin secretion/activation protein [Telluria sp.]
MLSKSIVALAVLALCGQASAQQAPTAGSTLRQIPPAPVPGKTVPKVELTPATPATAKSDDSATMVVKRLRVTGAQAYTEAQLLAVTGFVPNSVLTLGALNIMASRIAGHYHRNGYFVAQAYLPAQDIKDGVVTIAVLDGHYGKIVLNNKTNMSDALARELMSGINSGDMVAAAPLENRLMLLSDMPGVKVRSTLAPGASVGASDLIIDLTPGRRISGSVDADNAGNRYTGAWRAGATVNLNQPAGRGDVASLRVLSSGKGLNYARVSYQMQFGKVKAGAAYSHLRYRLGREFESLDAHGTARVASVFGSYPLLRSRKSNLTALLAYDDKTFQDRVGATGGLTDKKARVAMASLYGDARDQVGGGGLSAFTVTLSSGEIDIQTPLMREIDAASARFNGNFSKVGFHAMRLQRVTDAVSVHAAINGQLASKNLDVSEKMELGGMYGVRAYPEGEAYADQGYVLNLEARLEVPAPVGQLQLIAFADHGAVSINRDPWSAGPNRRTLSAAGVGFQWGRDDDFMLRAYYAHKLGNEAATSAPDKSGRFWVQAVKYF